jgi:hypothetical protein
MSASRCIGRVGGLAVALGVGAAILTTCGMACADDGSSNSSHPSATGSTTGSNAGPASARNSKRPSARAKTSPAADASAAPGLSAVDAEPPSTTSSKAVGKSRGEYSKPPAASLRRPTAAPDATAAVSTVAPEVTALPTASPLLTARSLRVAPNATIGTTTVPSGVVSLVLTTVAELGLAVAVSLVNPIVPSPTVVSPTLNLNGYQIVPSSTEKVTSFYGQWAYLPGSPSVVQGEQQFDVVDPKTRTAVGSFDALVTRGDGYNYTELLVTSTSGPSGTAAGQVPPVGSLISAFKLGPFGIGYTAMPTTSGNVVSFKLLTPFGDILLPMPFDAAKGIADQTVDNRPVRLTNGYYIAPADPKGEAITGVNGILPFFTTVQGHQVFNVYDSTGQSVGSFDGVFTTTADIIGTYTQAILVTGSDGAEHVPPVGTVYNVVYGGSDENYVLYSSMPSASGDVVSLSQVTPDGVTNSGLTFLDASTPPSTQPLKAPNGHTFVPTSTVQPVGVNGLPPREVQIQGYQKFDVLNSAGQRIGSFDADVYTQWDLLGIRSESLLITKVTGGTAGTGAGDVAPVGSLFNFVYFGNGFGIGKSVMPTPTGDVSRFKLITPLGDIQLLPLITPAGTRTDVSFFDPNASV